MTLTPGKDGSFKTSQIVKILE